MLGTPLPLNSFAERMAQAVEGLAGSAAWRGQDGQDGRRTARRAAERLPEGVRACRNRERRRAAACVNCSTSSRVRPPYGGHPRVFIWGLLEARLQQADLMVLGGLNEGVWPALPAPDPWLAPKIRANLGMPGLEFRTGLAAHDFASALGAPAGADHSGAARQPFADHRLAVLAAAAGDDWRAGARHAARAACSRAGRSGSASTGQPAAAGTAQGTAADNGSPSLRSTA